jgi:primase-polymerase (primpol)-like protein
MTTLLLRAHLWAHLPVELKALRQWCIAGADKAPLTVDAAGRPYGASVNKPGEWLDFETACLAADYYRYDIGFVLHESDPYCCIDIDVKDAENAPDKPELWTTAEQFDVAYRILTEFKSYSERSRSGKGLHIWARAKIGKGARRDGIELYSQERFIICTGDVVSPLPIADRSEMVGNMLSQMRQHSAQQDFALTEVEQADDDWYVLTRAFNASNSEKFCTLWQGYWQGNEFPSQSEADMALVATLAFYSESNAQCRRLFRMSALGRRDKAQKNDYYVNRTLRPIRARQEGEKAIDLSAVTKLAADVLVRVAVLSDCAHSAWIRPLGSGDSVEIAPAPNFRHGFGELQSIKPL